MLLEFISRSISKENKSSSSSDETLKKMFEQENKIKVSRKTISKYRILLNLPAAHNRKDENESPIVHPRTADTKNSFLI